MGIAIRALRPEHTGKTAGQSVRPGTRCPPGRPFYASRRRRLGEALGKLRSRLRPGGGRGFAPSLRRISPPELVITSLRSATRGAASFEYRTSSRPTGVDLSLYMAKGDTDGNAAVKGRMRQVCIYPAPPKHIGSGHVDSSSSFDRAAP